MDINVTCHCGADLCFEAEDNQTPTVSGISCPKCNADLSNAVNAFITKAREQVAPGAPGLQIRSSKPAAEAPPAPAPKPSSFATAGASHLSVQPPEEKSPGGRGFLMGVVGAVVAGFIGMMAWYLLIKWTNYEIGIVAWGIGVLVGIGTRLAAPDGHSVLGLVAATCAFVAIIGGNYLAVRDQVNKYFEQELMGMYDSQLAYAQKVVGATTDGELKKIIADEDAEPGEPRHEMTDEELAEFKKSEIPHLKEFAGGKPSREEYESTMRQVMKAFVSDWTLMKESVGLFTFLWLFLGVGSAYKMASGERG